MPAIKPPAPPENYLGPYERWIYTENLGRPYAFPAIRSGTAAIYTALLEDGTLLPDNPDWEIRTPPLWNPDDTARTISPFCFREKNPPDQTSLGQAVDDVVRCIATAL